MPPEPENPARRQPNPFRPGFNQAPLTLAGRDVEIETAREALQVAAYDGRTPRPVLLEGPRGVGKTVLLGRIAELAGQELSWPSVNLEITRGTALLPALIERLTEQARSLLGRPGQQRPTGRTRISAVKVQAGATGVGGEVAFDRSAPAEPAPTIAGALAEVAHAASTARAGLVLTLDELQLAHRDDLAELAAALQEAVPANWPLVVVAAGLPSMHGSKRRPTPTYFERGEWLEIGFLNPDDARLALTSPAQAGGRPMDPDAVQVLLTYAGGYPYALQVVGHHAWRCSTDEPTITVDAARRAQPAIARDLAALFRSRWADASTKEQEYLQALAAASEHGPVGGRAVADELGVPTHRISYLRERLIEKGTLYAANDVLHFIAPGMRDWITSTHPRP